MRITFLGDIMLGRSVQEIHINKGMEYVFGEIIHLLQGSDYIVANLEAPFCKNGEKYKNKDPHLSFKINPELITALKYLNISAVTLANNHITDFGVEGLKENSVVLVDAGIRFTGAGLNIDDALRPVSITPEIGMLGFNSFIPFSRIAKKKKFGTAQFDYQNVEEAINKYRNKFKGFFLFVHWGIDYHPYPIPKLIEIAQNLSSKFPEIIAFIGHHPHVLQPNLKHFSSKIYCSLGNFLFDEPFPLSRIGSILHLDMNGLKIVNESIDLIFLDEKMKLKPMSENEKNDELLRLKQVYQGIKNKHKSYTEMDKKWIKYLLYQTLKYRSLQDLRYIFKLYKAKEIFNIII